MIFLQTDLKPEFVREKQESIIFLLNGMNNVSEGCFMELKFYTNSSDCKAYCSHNHSWNKKKYVKKNLQPNFLTNQKFMSIDNSFIRIKLKYIFSTT